MAGSLLRGNVPLDASSLSLISQGREGIPVGRLDLGDDLAHLAMSEDQGDQGSDGQDKGPESGQRASKVSNHAPILPSTEDDKHGSNDTDCDCEPKPSDINDCHQKSIPY
jgi:hypothetical protein